MNKRPLTNETKEKMLRSAANILRLHGKYIGSRGCQDWSGKPEDNPQELFTEKEQDDIEYNAQIGNSNLRDYEKDLNFFGDEMCASFNFAYALDDMAEEIKEKDK